MLPDLIKAQILNQLLVGKNVSSELKYIHRLELELVSQDIILVIIESRTFVTY